MFKKKNKDENILIEDTNIVEEVEVPTEVTKDILTQAKRKKMGKMEWILVILPTVAIILAVLIMFVLMDNVTSYKFEVPGYQYYFESKYKIDKDTTLKSNKDGDIVLLSDGEEFDVSNIPIYQEELNGIVLQESMVYTNPREIIFKRVPYFSFVSGDQGYAIAKYGKKEAILDNGFLFDGKDLFIFLEDVTLKFNGYKMELPKFSYVEAVYQGYITAFNYETKEVFYEAPRTDVMVYQDAGDFEMSLLTHSVTNYKKDSFLLFTNVDVLDTVFYKEK